MRYGHILKVLLAVCVTCISVRVQAAEYLNGELWLQILLSSSTELTIAVPTGAIVSVAELSSPVSRELSGNIRFAYSDRHYENSWGVLLGSNICDPDTMFTEDNIRQRFVWKDQRLELIHELQTFDIHTFHSEAEAKTYAVQRGLSTKSVQAVPLRNSTVKAICNNQTYYFETPLKLSSTTSLRFNGSTLDFSGDFILKSVDDKLVLSHFLPMEDYVSGVIQNEIGSGAPLEAMKTQAVAARTHAISLLLYNRHLNDGYDLCNGTHCQVYKGRYLQNASIRQAVAETRDEVLLGDGRVADATYHSSCGGKTDSSANIWKGQPLTHLMGVTCCPEADSLDLSQESDARKWIDIKIDNRNMSSWERSATVWERSISRKSVAKNAGMASLKRIIITKRGVSGRIVKMTLVGDKNIELDSEYKIRQIFGNLPSSLFYIQGRHEFSSGVTRQTIRETLIIKGKGSGHGVGMCQVGALRMAREGETYNDILLHYYPGVQIIKDWKTK